MDTNIGLWRWKGHRWATLIFLGCFLLACPSLALAQTGTGTISGTATDQSSSLIPGVSVVVKNTDTGLTRDLVTNERGFYTADALPVGRYEVSASLAGFQTTVRSGIELTLGRNAVVDMTLQVGDLEQTVTVQGDVTHVETTTPTVSNLIGAKLVLDIPLNNRDLTQLAYFTAGVLKVPLTLSTSFSNTAVGGSGEKLSVNGARAQQNLYLLNGIPNSDASGNPQAVTGAYSGAESVREFQVITNSYSAEHPSVPGGIISAVTKSGSNAFHGSLFEFHRNDKLNSLRWEDKMFNRAKPDFERNQFGGSLGGPLFKDRTFFFVSYEGLREEQSQTVTFTTITAGPRGGSLGPVNPAVAPYLALWPLPGQEGTTLITDFGDGRALVAGSARRPLIDDYGSIRLDHRFESQRRGNIGLYFLRDAGHAENFAAYRASGGNYAQESKSSIISVQHTSVISNTSLNELLAGFTKTSPIGGIPTSPINWKSVNGVDLRFNPTTNEMGSINIPNIESVGYAGAINNPKHDALTLKNNLLLTRQRHTLKFGTQIQWNRDDILTNSNDDNGTYSFTSLQNFLQARPLSLLVNLPKGTNVLGLPLTQDPLYKLRQWQLGFYAQDNFTPSSSTTLTMGLRYEVSTVPIETRDHLWSLRDFENSVPTQGPLYTNPSLLNFSPRLGFVWSPGAHKFSLRGGIGIYYEVPSLFSTNFNLAQMIPNVASGQADDPTSSGNLRFPDAYTTQPQLLSSTPLARLMEYDMESAKIYRWSVTIDREIGTWLLSGGYTGSRSRNLLLTMEANLNKWDGWPNPVPSLQKHFQLSNGRINPTFARYTIANPVGEADYQGLTLNVQKRLTHGLQFQGGFTFSDSHDMGASSVNLGDSLAQSVRTAFYWETDGEVNKGEMLKGPSLFNIRKNFVGNATYELPASGRTGVVGVLADGWQLTGVLTLSDGFAFTLSDTGNTAQRNQLFNVDGLRPNLIPGGNPNPVLGGPDLYYDPTQFVPSTCAGARICAPGDPDYRTGYWGNLGYNTLIGPGYVSLDFSVIKNVNVTQNQRLQVRMEFFNLTNRANFNLPDTTPFLANGTRDPQAGKITQTRGTPRQMQIGLKYLF
jgi:hypothetical protein